MTAPIPPSRLDLHVRAPTLEALFVQAAQSMLALAGATAKSGVLIRRPVEVRGADYPSLLLAWLRELLAWMELEDRVFQDFVVVTLSPLRLHILASGGLCERVERRLNLELGLEIVIRQTAEGYETTIPFHAG
ncbi:MAG: archease [Anaerolineales bacterium]|nr:archease [Anaerolineales bacterium]